MRRQVSAKLARQVCGERQAITSQKELVPIWSSVRSKEIRMGMIKIKHALEEKYVSMTF